LPSVKEQDSGPPTQSKEIVVLKNRMIRKHHDLQTEEGDLSESKSEEDPEAMNNLPILSDNVSVETCEKAPSEEDPIEVAKRKRKEEKARIPNYQKLTYQSMRNHDKFAIRKMQRTLERLRPEALPSIEPRATLSNLRLRNRTLTSKKGSI
jgi:hypothetical protein